MIVEILYCLFLVGYFSILGLPFSYLFFSKKRSWPLLATLTGVAIAVIVNTSLWVNGSTIQYNFWAILILGVLGCLVLIISRGARLISDFSIRRRQLLIYMVGLILILFPLLLNGPKFSFFQGNIWDTFGYWEASQIYASEKFDRIKNYTEEELSQVPARRSAKKDLYARPGVHALYSLTTQAVPAWRWRLHPIFLAFLLSQVILVFLFWLENESQSEVGNGILLALAVLAYPLGFWGQYIFDINSWGNLSSVALIVMVCWMVREIARLGNRILVCALAFFLAAIFFLYPEISIFYAPGLLFLSLFELRLNSVNGFAWKKLAMGICSIFLALAIASMHYQGTIEFVINQVKFGSSETHGMWTYFQKFFFGQGNLAASLKEQAELLLSDVDTQHKTYAVGRVDWISFVREFIGSHGGIVTLMDFVNNLILGLLGLYWLTIPSDVPSSIYDFLVVSISFCLLTSFIFFFVHMNKKISLRFVPLLAGLVLTVLIFILKKQYWSVGKGISFLMPTLFIILAIQMLNEKSKHVRLGITLFFGLQLFWGIYRVTSVNSNGVNYPYPPYPSLQKHVTGLKSIFNSDLYDFSDDVKVCKKVIIDNINPWSSRVVEGILLSNSIPFSTQSQKLVDLINSEGIYFFKNNGDCLVTRK